MPQIDFDLFMQKFLLLSNYKPYKCMCTILTVYRNSYLFLCSPDLVNKSCIHKLQWHRDITCLKLTAYVSLIGRRIWVLPTVTCSLIIYIWLHSPASPQHTWLEYRSMVKPLGSLRSDSTNTFLLVPSMFATSILGAPLFQSVQYILLQNQNVTVYIILVYP